MIKFDTKALLLAYLDKTAPREGKYLVLQDETMQNKKSIYSYANAELILEGGGTTKLNELAPVATFADIATTYTTPVGLDHVVVQADETHDGQPTHYTFNGTAWVFNGIFFTTSKDTELSERNTRADVIAPEVDYTIPVKYLVGHEHLDIYLEGELLTLGIDFEEIGTADYVSNTIQFKFSIPKEARLVFKRI